jgi:hypothetical protein
MSKFKFHRNCIFQMTFSNGFTVSLSSIGGSYSDNRNLEYTSVNPTQNEVECIEVACWNEVIDGNFVRLGKNDDVLGYVEADKVASIIEVVSKAKNEEEIIEGIIKLGIK